MDFNIQAQIIPTHHERVQHITAFIEEETLKNILFLLILTFVSASVVIMAMILLRRTILQKEAAHSKVLKAKYETFLAESVSFFYEDDAQFKKKELTVSLNQEDTNTNFSRQILLDQILLMKKHVSGSEAEVLENLYQNLGFRKRSLNKLKKRFWFKRLEGLEELTLMESQNLDLIFHKLTKDKHHLVRSAAIRALILRGGDWQPALIAYDYPLCAWEKYQICDALSRRQSIQLPDFTPLLNSLNPTVIEFGLKMIKHFHCLDAVPQVLPFLKDENILLSTAAKEILKQFSFNEDGVMDTEDIFFNAA